MVEWKKYAPLLAGLILLGVNLTFFYIIRNNLMKEGGSVYNEAFNRLVSLYIILPIVSLLITMVLISDDKQILAYLTAVTLNGVIFGVATTGISDLVRKE